MIVGQAPPTSAIVAAQHPQAAIWGLQEHLLAAVLDAVRVANWQRGRAKRSEYPQPIPRPGVEPDQQKIGAEPIPMDEMTDWLGWNEADAPWRPDATEVVADE